jgi:hypothetical protein
MPWRALGPEEVELLLDGQFDYHLRTVAEEYPDCTFNTSDGRTFALIEGSDSIKNRIFACGHSIRKQEYKKLGCITGAIVETTEDDPPLLFRDFAAQVEAWIGLHQTFGVPLSERERIKLALDEDECDSEETGGDE